jgi:hypothetical protein
MAKIVRTEGGAHQDARPTGPHQSLWCDLTLGPRCNSAALRQTIRSDRDPSPAVMAHACTDRPEIDLLLESRP